MNGGESVLELGSAAIKSSLYMAVRRGSVLAKMD